ncbi:MAG: hypothetical protein U0Q22_15625 [Acidimicrobiales bacterium]
MIKANRDVWDIVTAMEDGEPITSWRLVQSYRVDLMRPGHPCFLWLTGSDRDEPPPGIYAAGVVTGLPALDAGADDGWADPTEGRKRRPYIDLHLPLLDSPVLRADLWSDARFDQVEIRTAAAMGNPLVLSPAEVGALADHITDLDRLLRDAATEGTEDPWTAQTWACEFGTGYEDLVTVFAERAVTCPPVPTTVRAELRSTDGGAWMETAAWSTHNLDDLPNLFDDQWRYFDRVTAAVDGDFVGISIRHLDDGSEAVSYAAVHGPIAFWGQHSMGTDPHSRLHTAAMFSAFGQLIHCVDDLQFPAVDRPLVHVVHAPEGLRTGQLLSYWAEAGTVDAEESANIPLSDLLSGVMKELTRVRAVL